MGRIEVAVALGSNLGDRHAHLAFALKRLGQGLDDMRVSSIHETEPVGVSVPQGRFLNQVAVGETARSPREVLDWLLSLERERGRIRPYPGAPRTLDLDLILAGSHVVSTADLTIPHPRFRDRLFVLRPLAEVAPEMVDPVTGRRVEELLTQVLAAERRRSGL
jgi:2-amino-4-hydroxy-6-hydroxymethyldihydropteridine diphosphokinase